jgi:hypothetical protein
MVNRRVGSRSAPSRHTRPLVRRMNHAANESPLKRGSSIGIESFSLSLQEGSAYGALFKSIVM